MDMANTHTVETIRQMLIDWNAATEAQRQEALRLAADAAETMNWRTLRSRYPGVARDALPTRIGEAVEVNGLRIVFVTRNYAGTPVYGVSHVR